VRKSDFQAIFVSGKAFFRRNSGAATLQEKTTQPGAGKGRKAPAQSCVRTT